MVSVFLTSVLLPAGLTNTQCQSNYPDEVIGSYHICAAFPNTDTCKGDSGGN